MSAFREPVPGRYYAEAGPGWVTLDAASLVDNNTHDLLELLMSDEFFERFMVLAAPLVEEVADGSNRLEFEQLKDEMVARLATRIRMTGQQARRVGARVYRLGVQVSAEADAATAPDVPAVSLAKTPGQRNRRWTA